MHLAMTLMSIAFASSFAPRVLYRRAGLSAASVLFSTATSMNPLLDQKGLPRFESIEPSHLEPAVSELLGDMSRKFKDLESRVSASGSDCKYDDVLPELERIQEPIGYTWGVAGHLNGVKNGEELRKAYEASQPDVVKAFTEFKQSRVLYDSMKRVLKDEGERGLLTGEQVRALEGSLHAMTLGGVGLDGKEKERFNEIKQRLAELATSFGNNVLDSTKLFSLTITDPEQVRGVPDSVKNMWAAAASADAEKGDGDGDGTCAAGDGPWKITLDGPSYIPAMQHLKDRGHREKLYRAYVTRASESSGDKNNIDLINEILRLKLEMSKLLGFGNYAEQSLSSKMADDVSAVDNMSKFLKEKALPAAERELAEITEHARANGGEEYSEGNLERLMNWDTPYWSERLKESRFDMKEVRRDFIRHVPRHLNKFYAQRLTNKINNKTR